MEVLELGDGVDGAVVAGVPRAGPTRLGPVTWWPPSISAIASAATRASATAPPVAIPAANVRRSRRYSVRRRSRSWAGSAARRAARLLYGAAARPRVGNSSSAASSGPLSSPALVSPAMIPARPNTASVVSAQLTRRALNQLVSSPVFGVRRKAAFFANRASTEQIAALRLARGYWAASGTGIRTTVMLSRPPWSTANFTRPAAAGSGSVCAAGITSAARSAASWR